MRLTLATLASLRTEPTVRHPRPADGSKLVYLAGPADNVGEQRIAVLDIQTSTTTMINAGDVDNFDGGNAPVVTSNGHFVAFRTDDPAVTGFSGQHAGDYAIMIADTATGARTLVSTSAGQPLDDPFAPAFSPDDRTMLSVVTSTPK